MDKKTLPRTIAVGLFFFLACGFFIIRLIQVQITGQDYYISSKDTSYTTRTETIAAQRGEIFDRNGVPLVKNQYAYSIRLDGGSIPAVQSERNALLLALLADAEATGEADAFTLPDSPYIFSRRADGNIRVDYNEEFFETTRYLRRFNKLITDLHSSRSDPAGESVSVFLSRYGLTTRTPDGVVFTYDMETTALLLAIRLDMELHDFSAANPYTLLNDVSFELVCRIEEAGYRGAESSKTASRIYCFPGYCSHILGRIGKIQEQYVDYFTSLGYPLDATVGVSGAELAFETYLHGKDGVRTIVEDAYGNIVDEYVSEEAVAGGDVYLTIDINLQIVAEDALAANIETIHKRADNLHEWRGTTLNGEDADAGALTVMSVKTGEVLAIASNPTFDLATFNEDFNVLRNDSRKPLFNRALEGTYQPGSTFKVGVAAAALSEGIITPETIIVDKGVYTFYDTYQPACWVWNQDPEHKATHGPVNVTRAIQVSCNYFFFEVGRLLTIDLMNKYDLAFGLGVPTGIELSEKTGILAGPQYRIDNDLGPWNPGDTIQASIGQSDNLFTPLQISTYIATILNNGTRLNAHVLYRVVEFGSRKTLYQTHPTTAGTIELGEGVRDILMNAMKNVLEDDGSASNVFKDFPMEIGAKTGTAQTTTKQSDNAIFTAFAPYNDPQIVATCIIEKGASGTQAGWSVKDVFAAYFGLN